MHWALAITNACNGLKYVTRFSCDIFGFYVAFIYLQKGIQVLTRQWGLAGESSAYLSIMISLLVLMTGYACGFIGGSNLFQRYIRKFVEDYGTPLTIIFFTGFIHIGHMNSVALQTLPTSMAFFPTQDRGWFIHFWDINIGDIFIAIPFAVLLTILFYFDHNGKTSYSEQSIIPVLSNLAFHWLKATADRFIVSSLIAQGTEFPLRKPAGFHWDIFLLGLTTGIAGLLGIPFPNGLIPQAPFHTNSLCVTRQVSNESESGTSKGHTTRVVDHVVEQRVSNLAQGLLTLGTMSGPLLVVLHLIPQGVLAGLFFIMGVQALEGNGITVKMLYLCRDRNLTLASDPLSRIQRKQAIWYFVALELIGFGATFAITQTIAAIGFPIIILLLVPVRSFMLPKYFTTEELALLDAPTASPFTMESVGGNFGEAGAASHNGTSQNDNVSDRRGSEEESIERGEVTQGSDDTHRRASFRGNSSSRRAGSHEMQPTRPGNQDLSHTSQSRGGGS